MTEIKQDEYKTVVNDRDTYANLAYKPRQYGHLQRGMNSLIDLFVAVSCFGMLGFEFNCIEKYAGYIGEKLGLGQNVTTEKLSDLVNGVMEAVSDIGFEARNAA